MGAPDRVAFATAQVDGLALGDPTGAHLLLSAAGVTYRRGPAGDPILALGWPEVQGIEVDAPATRARRPAAAAVLLGAAAESVGLTWGPGTAPVSVTVQDADGAVPLECDGYVGRGYWAPHLEVLTAALHVLVAHPDARAVLGRPAQALADLDRAAGGTDVRGVLAEAWGTGCACVA